MGLLVISFSGAAQTWNQVAVPTQEKLNDIQFIDDQIGYIAGENLTLLKTTDGGINWTVMSPQGLPSQGGSYHIQELEFIDASTGYLTIQSHGSVYKTTDGGLNWTAIVNNQTNQCFPWSVYAFGTDDLITGGSDCFQGATLNSYQTPNWTNLTINYNTWDTQHFVREIDFDGNIGLAAVNNEFFLRTTDGGTTWDSINSNIGNGNVLTSVFIADNDTCYAGYNQNGSGFGILYSSDFGLTWQEDFNSATFFYPAYYGATENNAGKVYMAAVPYFNTGGLIFERTGSSWDYGSVDQPVYSMDSYGNDVTWAVGDSGYVVVNKELGLLSISSPSTSFESIVLHPNPTKDILEWNCEDCIQESVQIYDLTGTKMLEFKEPFMTSICVSHLPTGVYVFQLKSDSGTYRERFVKE